MSTSPIIRINIEGLRGFTTEQSLVPAIPTGAVGSGLTVVVGPNNGGKSTVIEALRAMTAPGAQRSFSERVRNHAAGSKVRITLHFGEGQSHTLRTVDGGGSETVWEHQGSFTPADLFVVPSRRAFESVFGKHLSLRADYRSRIAGTGRRPLSQDSFGFRLFNIQANRAAFDLVLGKIFQPVPNWYIEQQRQNEYYLKYAVKAGFHDSEGIGDGITSLFVIVDALYDSKPGEVVVIDEPELSLHPTLQRKLANLLLEYSADRQIILATHSPYFVDLAAVTHGARVARVHLKNSASTISQLSSESGKAFASLADDLNNPHTLGLDAREAFFLDDRLILTEGQEDVQLLNKISIELATPLSGTFYGWGVGGASKMKHLAAVFRDLGFERVVGILDRNKADLIQQLSKDFPQYAFFALPADDVRTKKAQVKPAVVGLLDERFRVRPEHISDTKDVLVKINSYLSSN